jgi:hypothetical protein
MKHLLKIFTLFSLGLLLGCEAKPERYTEFFPEEEQATILLGLIARQGLQLTNYGTAIDPSKGIEWKRCSQGQGFRLEENDCRGVVNGTLFTPVDSGTFGAHRLTFCSFPSMDCNEKVLPFALNQPEPGAPYTSEAYLSCASDRTGGFSNWRLPTTPELKAFSSGGKNALYDIFSSTVQDKYWTSWSNEKDPWGKTAYVISFAQDTWGEEDVSPKDFRHYVRCVRNLN